MAIQGKDKEEKKNNPKGARLDASLRHITKGTAVIITGSAIGAVTGLIITILIARTLSTADYGLFTIGLIFPSLLIPLGSLGLFQGAWRFTSFYLGKKHPGKVKSLLLFNLKVLTVSSTIIFLVIFLSAEFMAENVFHNARLTDIIRIFALSIPFQVLIQMLTSVFRGFGLAKERVLFFSFGLPFVVLLGIVALFSMGHRDVVLISSAFPLSSIIVFLFLVGYSYRKFGELGIRDIRARAIPVKRILGFSLPLILAEFSWLILANSDKLLLGALISEEAVGIYNYACPLAAALTFFHGSSIFMYTPVQTRLLAEGKLDELKRNFQVMTKWIYSVSFPFMVIFFIFSRQIINIFFDQDSAEAAMVLKILVMGYFFHILFGPNGATITLLGKTRIIMYAVGSIGILNVILNIYLIDLWGLVGAAVATTVSYIVLNLMFLAYLVKRWNLHPFSASYLRPVAFALALVMLLDLLVRTFDLTMSLAALGVSFFLIILIWLGSMRITRGIEKEDRQLVRSIWEMFGKGSRGEK